MQGAHQQDRLINRRHSQEKSSPIITYIGSLLLTGKAGRDDGGHSWDDGLLIGSLAAPTTLFLLLQTRICQRRAINEQHHTKCKHIRITERPERPLVGVHHRVGCFTR